MKPDRCAGCGVDLADRTVVVETEDGARFCRVCWVDGLPKARKTRKETGR